MSLLLDRGGLYKTFNGNLLFHGCIPLNEDGSLKEVQIYGKTYKGKELYDVLEAYVRRAFFAVDNEEQRKGRDILWFIWASPNSPLFGKDKMTTFERYFIADKATHKEVKGAYYRLLENEEVIDSLLREFGLDPAKGHITTDMCRYIREKARAGQMRRQSHRYRRWFLQSIPQGYRNCRIHTGIQFLRTDPLCT